MSQSPNIEERKKKGIPRIPRIQSEKWFAVLGTVCGVVSVASSKKDIKEIANKMGYDISGCKIVTCDIVYTK